MPRPSVLACVLTLSACGLELNPPRPPPTRSELAPGGVWVAYNLGCDVGCDQVRRGDRILAVDDRPVSSGAELDAIGLDRGTPVKLRVARHGSVEIDDVTIVATPNDRLPPIAALPPLLTVGAVALDQAPDWARSKLFGHAIPAIRFYRADEPRGFATGRQFYGRAALLVVWELPSLLAERRASLAELPGVYAHLQAFADQLETAGVHPAFVTDFRAEPAFRDETRSHADPGETGYVPIFELASAAGDPNTVGLEGSAADIRQVMFDHVLAPVVIIIDRRGIVRFHTRGFPLGPPDTLAAAIDFALHALPDVPAAPQLAPAYASAAIRAQAR